MSYIDSVKAPEVNNGIIKLHSKSDFEVMREAGRIASNTLDMISEYVNPGIKTDYLDELCRKYPQPCHHM